MSMSRIYVAGHRGMVGSAVVRRLEGKCSLILRTREELDLLDHQAVSAFFAQESPDVVVLCAARVGGILANFRHNGEFLYENSMIQNHVIHEALKHGVEYFCFLGSSCIYPKHAPQPISEEALLSSPLESTNEGYALAKIAGLKLLQFYREKGRIEGISLMPCNLYGTNDCFDPERSHVLSALVKRFCDAHMEGLDSVVVWGTGEPRREFMHVDDVAAAIDHCVENRISASWLNVGWGVDVTIRELAHLIAEKVGYMGEIVWDHTKPNGTMAKCMDVSRMKALGFTPQIELEDGIEQTIEEYCRSVDRFQVEAH